MDKLMKLTEWLATHPLFVILACLCSIIAVPLAIYLAIKSRREKRPRYAMRSYNIINKIVSKVPSLQMSYSGYGDPIDTLTVTKVLFWNAGNETINKQDIVKMDSLSIYAVDKTVILEAGIIQLSKTANQFDVRLSRDKSHVTLSFDYLDSGDGAVIQLFHTGKGSKQLQVRGLIKGAGKPKEETITPRFRTKDLFRWVVVIFISYVVYMIMSEEPVAPNEVNKVLPHNHILHMVLSLVTCSIGIIVFTIIFIWSLGRRVAKQFIVYSEPFYED